MAAVTHVRALDHVARMLILGVLVPAGDDRTVNTFDEGFARRIEDWRGDTLCRLLLDVPTRETHAFSVVGAGRRSTVRLGKWQTKRPLPKRQCR